MLPYDKYFEEKRMINSSFIILLYGASGSGKSTLMELLLTSGGQYSIHMKGTDRSPRQYDGIEIICDPEFGSDKYDYIYQTYGYRYGIKRKQIDESIRQRRHHFIICNDISTIRAIKRDYGEAVKVVFHYFDAPQEEILRIQKQRGISDDEVNLRLAKTSFLYRQFVEEWRLFDASLCNHFGDDLKILRKCMEDLLSEFAVNARNTYESSKMMNRLDEFVKKFGQKLPSSLYERSRIVEKGYIFIVMAIKEDDPDNIDVHHTIKRVCGEFGLKADRVDDIQFTGQITEKIQGCIEIAEFIIADLTNERPNVYYEIGYADACGKPLLLVAKHGTNVHFDIQGKKVLFYKGIYQLESHLKKFLEDRK